MHQDSAAGVISRTTGQWSDAPYISLRISHILTRSAIRSLRTTAQINRSASGLHILLNSPTHVEPPPYSFRTTIKSVREISVMVVVWVKLSPDIDKRARVTLRWVQNVGKRRRLGFCVTCSFVPVCFWIAQVYGRHIGSRY
jgi:hypothetical protein